MMVLNMRNKQVWLGAAVSLAVIALVWIAWVFVFSTDSKSSQPASSQSNLQQDDQKPTAERAGQQGFFAEYRMERESLRGMQMEMLGQIINDSSAEKNSKQAASIRLTQIGEDMEKEMKMESLIKSKGFSDCVVIPQSDVVTVVVSASKLNTQQENDIRQVVGKAKNQSSKILITLIEP